MVCRSLLFWPFRSCPTCYRCVKKSNANAASERIPGNRAESIANANGAQAEVKIEKAAPVTNNDAALTERMIPALKRVTAQSGLRVQPRTMVAEDFSYFQQQIPGMFYFVGVTPKGEDMASAAPNHSPRFFVDESALLPGMRSLAALALDFLTQR